ncbi:hypothetical protein, partial [Sinorhizobium fredii]
MLEFHNFLLPGFRRSNHVPSTFVPANIGIAVLTAGLLIAALAVGTADGMTVSDLRELPLSTTGLSVSRKGFRQ